MLRLPGARTTDEGDHTLATWDVVVPPGQAVTHELLLTVDDTRAAVSAPSRRAGWSQVEVASADRRLAPVLERSLDDLRLLRLAARGADDVEEEFIGAGAPWFLTLFGRDSLWTARMLLPVTTDLAMSTLRLLAHHQGTRTDDVTAEEPGKILHEVRSAGFSLGEDDGADRHLPPVYYGTIDATPLWAMTLHDAWRWGAPADEVERLLPALERALAWQVEHGDADGDLLLEYVDRSGHGLSNQGWKDSGDAVRRSDGSRATSPLALAEVQGYAYAAATRGADLLEAFGRPGADRWREWAELLRAEFARRFWVEDALGAFPAIALDRDKRPVVSLTSNIGHLLGTGILDADGVDVVARRLVGSDMLSGFGIRTLSTQAAGYSPTGYHVGSVWPHDTAICLAGLAAEQRSETAPVAEALLSALTAFDGRPPELFAGDARATQPVPLPYPAACRPQAWSAASAVSLVGSVLGLRPDRDSLCRAGAALVLRGDPHLRARHPRSSRGHRGHGRRRGVRHHALTRPASSERCVRRNRRARNPPQPPLVRRHAEVVGRAVREADSAARECPSRTAPELPPSPGDPPAGVWDGVEQQHTLDVHPGTDRPSRPHEEEP